MGEGPTATMTSSAALIDEFVRQSRLHIGHVIEPSAPWHRVATRDAIRHFAYGISDDNPLWLDGDYAARSPCATLLAPPSFLLSVHYPVLAGAPVQVPLVNLIAELEFRWHEPIRDGDAFTVTARQIDVVDSRDRYDRRTILLSSASEYRNQRGALGRLGVGNPRTPVGRRFLAVSRAHVARVLRRRTARDP